MGWWKREGPETAKGMIAGMIAGLVASWVMTGFQAGVSRAREKQKNAQAGSDEPATVKTAVLVSEQVFGRGLPAEKREVAGAVVHYAFGTLAGGMYGALAEWAPKARAGEGTAFGAGLWLASDEIAVPLAGLAKGPQAYPLSTHAYALASHLVYGATTEVIRKGLRSGWLAR